MDEQKQDIIRLFDLVASQLVEGNFQVLQSLTQQNDLNPTIKDSIKTITTLFIDITQQSSANQIDLFFYRDIVRDIVRRQNRFTEDSIMIRCDIALEKKEQVAKLIKMYKQMQKFKIEFEGRFQEQKRKIQAKDKQIALNQIQKRNLQIKIQKMRLQISQLQQNIQNQELILHQKMVSSEKQQQEFNQMKFQILNQSQIKLETKQQEISRLKNQIQNLNRIKQQIVKETDNKLTKKQQKIDCLQKQVQKLNSVIKNSQNNSTNLEQKQEEINCLKKQIQKSQDKFNQIRMQLVRLKVVQTEQINRSNNLEAQLNSKSSIIQQYLNKSTQYQTIIKEKQLQISSLKQQLLNTSVKTSYLNSSRRMKSQIFIDSNSLIQQFQMDQTSAETLLQNIKKHVGQVIQMKSLYNYSLHKGQNFHKRIDNKKNILLLCLTNQNKIIGGFTSAGFSLKQQQRNTKAFIFNFCDNNMKIFNLKKGKPSIIYDYDFIVFGNEELCITKNSNQLTSYFVKGPINTLHYEYVNASDRQTFLSQRQDDNNRVILKNYEIIELKIVGA